MQREERYVLSGDPFPDGRIVEAFLKIYFMYRKLLSCKRVLNKIQ